MDRIFIERLEFLDERNLARPPRCELNVPRNSVHLDFRVARSPTLQVVSEEVILAHVMFVMNLQHLEVNVRSGVQLATQCAGLQLTTHGLVHIGWNWKLVLTVHRGRIFVRLRLGFRTCRGQTQPMLGLRCVVCVMDEPNSV